MPKYHYTTVDAHGRPVAGHVEATGPDDMRCDSWPTSG